MMVEAVSVEAVGGGARFNERAGKRTRGKLPKAARRTSSSPAAMARGQRVHARSDQAGQTVKGAAIIIEPHQTIVIEPGWQAELTAKNHLVLTRAKKLKRTHAIGTHADPVMLEVFNNLFMSIAEQMGVSLQNTAYSVNIKERLDFSCAVFAHDGTLVANAPHMPVHLGSMDRAVETIIRENAGRIAPGDVYAINAPYNGGTHLPDITVCTPVFESPLPYPPPQAGEGEREGGEILFWVASRGHHADVGGISPGSMSPNATTIEQEGVYLDNFKLVDRGRFREQELMDALTRAQLSGAQPGAERQRHQGADRRQREGRGRAAQDGGAIHAAGREGLYAACAGQRRRKRAAGDRPAARRFIRLRDGPGHRDQGEDFGRQGTSARRPSISPARARSSRPISTRPSR